MIISLRNCLPCWCAALLLGAATSYAADDPPTFAKDIAPILADNCIECHRPNGIGPFSFVTYPDARRRARQIAEVTASGYMPPWKPDSSHSPAFIGERSLTAEQIALLSDWAETGAEPGDLDTLTPRDLPDGEWQLGEPDLIITFPEPYDVPAEGMDIFRNFVLPIPVEQRRFVRAVEFLPESSLVVHHAIIAFDPTNESRELDAADPGPGFESMDTGGGVNPNGHIIGWTPGQVPYEVYPGTQFAVEPGTDLVVLLHLLPSGRPESLSPRIGLHFTDHPPEHTGFTLLLREDEIFLPAGSKGITVEESITLPAPAAVLGAYPHAHYLGNDMRITATLPDGSEQMLLHIPDWDFNWQTNYRYREPFPLPSGTRIDMRYSYDNSADNPRNPSHPPVDVRAGNSSFDEMGSATIQLLLENPADLPRFNETQSRYAIASGEGSPDVFFNLAVSIEQQGREDDAIAAYQDALAIDPHHIFSLNNLASLRERRGEYEAAASLYRSALNRAPNENDIRMNLIGLLQKQGNTDAIRDVLREGLALRPDDLELRSRLAAVLQQQEQTEAALAQLEAGLLWHENDPRLQLQLARALLALGRTDEAKTRLARTVSLRVPADQPNAEQTTLMVHQEARLLRARLAIEADELGQAVQQLVRLLRQPADTRPEVEFMVSRLPYPAALPVMAQALIVAGERDTARELLAHHAQRMRDQGRSELADALLDLRDQLQ